MFLNNSSYGDAHSYGDVHGNWRLARWSTSTFPLPLPPPAKGGDLKILPPCGGGKGGGEACVKPKRKFDCRTYSYCYAGALLSVLVIQIPDPGEPVGSILRSASRFSFPRGHYHGRQRTMGAATNAASARGASARGQGSTEGRRVLPPKRDSGSYLVRIFHRELAETQH